MNLLTRITHWWNGGVDERRAKLAIYASRYAGVVVPARYLWSSSSLEHTVRVSVSETFACTDCGVLVMRTPSIDGVQLHEDWHWRVDRVTGN